MAVLSLFLYLFLSFGLVVLLSVLSLFISFFVVEFHEGRFFSLGVSLCFVFELRYIPQFCVVRQGGA